MGAVPGVPDYFAGTGGGPASEVDPNALLRGVNRINAPHRGRHGSRGMPGLGPGPRAKTPRTGLTRVREALQRPPAPPSDGPASSGQARRRATTGSTTSERDPRTPDPRRTHQRVRSSSVMIEFLHPTRSGT